MEENILAVEWKTPKRNSANIIKVVLGLIVLNPIMYFFVMPAEQTNANSHSASFISPLVFLTIVACFIIGFVNLSKKKNSYISYWLIAFNLIIWLYFLAQITCESCSKV